MHESDSYDHERRFDEAGRIVLPPDWCERCDLSGGVVLIPRALSPLPGYFATDIWPNDDCFEGHLETIDKLLNGRDGATRRQKRFIYAAIFYKQIEPDGRLHINYYHRDISQLGDTIACVDMLDHLELWNLNVWQKRSKDLDDALSGW